MQNTNIEHSRESFEHTLTRCVEEVKESAERMEAAGTQFLDEHVAVWTNTAMLCNLGAVMLEIHHQNERIIAAVERLEPKGKK